MKISKRQLRRIIKEEKRKLVKEQWDIIDDPDPSSHEDFAPDLYVNLTDEQAAGLDELEVLVGRLLDMGTQTADILDTVTSLAGTGTRS